MSLEPKREVAKAAAEVEHGLRPRRPRDRRHVGRERLSVLEAGEDALAQVVGVSGSGHRQPIIEACHESSSPKPQTASMTDALQMVSQQVAAEIA